MRRSCVLVVCLLAACSSSNGSPRKLVILHSNDEHSHLLGYGPEYNEFPAPTAAGTGTIKGGASRRLIALQAARDAAKSSGADTLTLSAGDNMMGTLMEVADTTAAPDYRSMSLLSYDATTLGNHEFDYTPAGLVAIINAAKGSVEKLPPIVSTNIRFSGTSGDSALAALFDESGTDSTKPIHRTLMLTTANGLKVGLIGILGADAAAVAPLKAPVKFSIPPGGSESDRPSVVKQIISDVQPYVTNLRHNGADVVIALSHSGATVGNAASEDFQIAQGVQGLDVVVSGHTHTEVPAQVLTAADGRSVMVQQAGRYGDHIGQMSLSVAADGTITFDTANSKLIAVDDTTVPAAGNPVDALVTSTVNTLETTPIVSGGPSYLNYTVAEALSAKVLQVDPTTLFNYPISGNQTWDVDNSHQLQETQLLDLAADAQLAAANSVAPTQLAVEASGVLRVPALYHSKNNTFGFADVFDVVPLGISPATETPGYPLCRFFVYMAEVKATFEVTAAYSYNTDSDLFVVPAGFRFTYDTTRPPFNSAGSSTDPNNGRVTKIEQLSSADLAAGNYDGTYNTVFDLSKGGYVGVTPLTLVSVASSLYIAEFATVAGVTLKNADGSAVPNNDPASTIVHRRTDGSEIKEWEALAGYMNANGVGGAGLALPTRYETGVGTTPRRAICAGANATSGNCAH